jgi:hypothetical protein
VTKGLREVTEQLPSFRVDFLCQQAEIVAERSSSLEDGARSIDLISHGERLRQPKGAEQEGAHFAGEAVEACSKSDNAMARSNATQHMTLE